MTETQEPGTDAADWLRALIQRELDAAGIPYQNFALALGMAERDVSRVLNSRAVLPLQLAERMLAQLDRELVIKVRRRR